MTEPTDATPVWAESRDRALHALRVALDEHDNDPAAQLAITRAVRDMAAQEKDRAILAAEASGMSFGQIAQTLGITRQAARDRWRLLSGNR